MHLHSPHIMGVKLIILAALGLGALYMIHLLAQDYNKIRRPVAAAAIKAAKSLLLGKRDLSAVMNLEQNQHFLDKQIKLQNKTEAEFKVDWKNLLQKDPLKCALSLICQLNAGAENKNQEAQLMLQLFRYSINKKSPKEVIKYYDLGQKYDRQPNKCFAHAPFCPYSAKTMFKMLSYYSYFFG